MELFCLLVFQKMVYSRGGEGGRCVFNSVIHTIHRHNSTLLVRNIMHYIQYIYILHINKCAELNMLRCDFVVVCKMFALSPGRLNTHTHTHPMRIKTNAAPSLFVVSFSFYFRTSQLHPLKIDCLPSYETTHAYTPTNKKNVSSTHKFATRENQPKKPHYRQLRVNNPQTEQIYFRG